MFKRTVVCNELQQINLNYILILDISCPSPKTVLCREVYYVAWRETKPYLYQHSTNHTGLIPYIFEKALRGCCRGGFHLNYSVQYKSQDEMMDIQANYTVDFVMPVSTEITSKKFLHYPFVSVGKIS